MSTLPSPGASPTVAPTRELPALTSARFFAAFAVLLFHFGAPLLQRLTAIADESGPAGVLLRALCVPLDWAVHCGGLGVSFFFVLSGFILTHVYVGGGQVAPIDRRRFGAARFARIYPIYLFGFLASTPFFVPGLLHPADGSNGLPVVAASGVSAVLLLHAWLATWLPIWNFPSWSIAVEAFFYTLFPWLGPRLAALQPTRRILIGGVIWLLGMSIPAAFLIFNSDLPTWHGLFDPRDPPPGSPWVGFLDDAPIVHLHEFIVGIVGGRLFAERRTSLTPMRADLLTLIGLVGVYATLPLRAHLPYVLFHDGLLAPPSALAIYGLASGGRLGALVSGRWLHRLGEASYSLYTIQAPVFGLVLWLFQTLASPVLSGPDGRLLLSLTTLGAAVAISLLTERLIERPSRRWLTRLLGAHSTTFATQETT